jgi:hypothetical protein
MWEKATKHRNQIDIGAFNWSVLIAVGASTTNSKSSAALLMGFPTLSLAGRFDQIDLFGI